MDPYLGEDAKRAKASRSKAFVRALEEIHAAYTTGALHDSIRNPGEPLGPPPEEPAPTEGEAAAPASPASTSSLVGKSPKGKRGPPAAADAAASPAAAAPKGSKASRKRAPTEEDLEAQRREAIQARKLRVMRHLGLAPPEGGIVWND